MHKCLFCRGILSIHTLLQWRMTRWGSQVRILYRPFPISTAQSHVRAGARSVGPMNLSLSSLIALSLIGVSCSAPRVSGAESDAAAASSVSTFHCLSLYWSPKGGQAGRQVMVRYRQAAEPDWHEGLAMRYNPVKTPECKADYRGSIVNLKPGTAYEVSLSLQGTDVHTSLTASTWAQQFPVASTVHCKSGATTLIVNKSGTPDGYVLYDGAGCVIDCGNNADLGISVDANYVILRGFTIRHVKQHGIRIFRGHHIVIEGCDISQWGSEEENGFGFEQQAAVFSKDKNLHAVVIQRCKLHNPSWNSNSWAR
jgi:hypothetical protein